MSKLKVHSVTVDGFTDAFCDLKGYSGRKRGDVRMMTEWCFRFIASHPDSIDPAYHFGLAAVDRNQLKADLLAYCRKQYTGLGGMLLLAFLTAVMKILIEMFVDWLLSDAAVFKEVSGVTPRMA